MSYSSLEPLRHYLNAGIGGAEFLKNNRQRQSWNYFLRPFDVYVVNPITDLATKNITLPALKRLYALLGTSTVTALKYVNQSSAEKVENALYDPLSTKSLLKVGKLAQSLSLYWAKRMPIQSSIITYPDTCSVVAARHLHTFARDMNAVLDMATKSKNLASHVSETADKTIIQPYLNKHQTTNLLARVAGVFKYSPKDILEKMSHDMIDKNEKKVRQSIVGTAVQSVCRGLLATCLRGFVRGGTSFACYRLIEHTIVEIVPNAKTLAHITSFSITAAGTLIWLKCLSSTAERLNSSYREKFDPKSSTFQELTELVGQRNIDAFVTAVKNRLCPYLSGDSCIQNFTREVAGIQQKTS